MRCCELVPAVCLAFISAHHGAGLPSGIGVCAAWSLRGSPLSPEHTGAAWQKPELPLVQD